MSGYKDFDIPVNEEAGEQIVGICEYCDTAINTGQTVWKVGDEFYCSRSCLHSDLKIVTLRV